MRQSNTASEGRPSFSWTAAAAITLAIVSILLGPNARASGRIHVDAGPMFRLPVVLRAGRSYLITTSNLSAGSDTIVEVVAYPSGSFIAGGDNTIDPDGGLVSLASSVSIGAASIDRQTFVIVRGKPGKPQGTCTLDVRGFQGLSIVSDNIITPVAFSAGFVLNVASLAAGTHVTTVEEALGTIDTMIMIVGITPTTALAFDDDDGIDRMSFLRLGSACSGACQIIVGVPTTPIRATDLPAVPGGATLVWDETIEVLDSDRDGLSNAFETNVSFTNPSSTDTDGDGISDGFEVYGGIVKIRGVEIAGGGKNGNLLKFPKYGANPLGQDVFVEVDWVPACPGHDANCCLPGDVGCSGISKDGEKSITAANAPDVLGKAASAMNAAAVAHFDAAIPTATGDINVTYGDWGGAGRLSDDATTFTRNPDGTFTSVVAPDTFLGFTIDQDCFTGSTFARSGFFHHLIVSDDATNGRTPDSFFGALFESAACAFVHTNDGSIAHELGHNFNLQHGGFENAADGTVNCKMNYPSIMSYPNQGTNPFAPGYSFGRYEPRVLNGTAMSESAGLGINPITEAAALDVFNSGAMARGFVDPITGAIDWNMDGRIEPGLVRAPVNWANTTCAAPYLRGSFNLYQGSVAFPNFDIGMASTSAPQLFTISTNPKGGFPNLNIGVGDPTNCAQPRLGDCTSWPLRVSVALLKSAASGPTVAGALALYAQPGGALAYVRQVPVVISNPRPGVPRISQGFQSVVLGGPPTTGDPAAIEVDGHVRVYAVSQGNLRRWEYEESSNTWLSQGIDELWDDNSTIHSKFGIAVIHGAVRPDGEGIFAAIPNVDRAAAGDPLPIEFAKLVSTTTIKSITVPDIILGFFVIPGFTFSFPVRVDRWQRLPLGGNPVAQFSKPGLAYAPFDLSVPNDGRFYLTFVPGGNGFQSRTARIMFTEGNDLASRVTSRRLIWKVGQQTTFADDGNQNRDVSAGVVLARFGQSVVGASTLGYFPAVDGIINMDFHDYPDDLLVRHNLACSVHGDECDQSP